jgi:hypothetical protein
VLAWWDAAFEEGFSYQEASTTRVAKWTDRVGGVVLTSDNPTYTTRSRGQLAVVAANEFGFFHTSQIPDYFPAGGTEAWIMALGRYDDGGNNDPMLLSYGSSAFSGMRKLGFLGHDTASADWGKPLASTTVYGYSGEARADPSRTGTPVLLAARFTSVGIELWVNGVLVPASPGNYNAGPDTSAGAPGRHIRLFRNEATANLVGNLYGAMVATAMTVEERQKAEAILVWRAGMTSLLPVGHPYKTISPL